MLTDEIKMAFWQLSRRLLAGWYLIVFLMIMAVNHTPNYGWMGAITYSDLLNSSHLSLFNNIFIPVFRPFLHIENIAANLCGIKCVSCVNGLFYSGFTIFVFSLFYLRSRFVFDKKCMLGLAYCFAMPFYVLLFRYGSFTDVIYPSAVIFLMSKLIQKGELSWSDKVLIVISIICCDLSKPFFLYAFPVLICSIIFSRKRQFAKYALFGFLAATPYHLVQFINLNTLTLSNWGGCNFAEAYYYKAGFDVQFETLAINSVEAKVRCNQFAASVLDILLNEPGIFFKNFMRFERVILILFPGPFIPYGGENIFDVRSLKVLVWLSMIVFFYLPLYFESIRMLINLLSVRMDLFIFSIFLYLPGFFMLIGHSGQESGRLSLAFILPVIYFQLLCRENEEYLMLRVK